jgi:hypothetical protein
VPVSTPTPLRPILVVIFLAGISSGVFWTGLFFLTREHYGFSVRRNLILGACMGAASALAARSAGPLCQTLTQKRVLMSALGCWAVAALLPVIWLQGEPVVWVSALVGAACSALVWSVAESYVAGGRSGAELRGAVGIFALSWTPATALALIMALACSARISVSPEPVAPSFEVSSVHPEYPLLLRSAFVLLPIGYLISSTLGPVLPQRFSDAGLQFSGSSAASVWLVARFVTLLVMWRVHAWHGRWETLAFGVFALVSGLGLVLLATTPAGLLLGLGVYGVGMGISYYAALYYMLAVGHDPVHAGGHFEVAVGLAYAAGPVLGVLAHSWVSAEAVSLTTLHLTLLAALLLAPRGWQPYWQARRQRGAGV